MRWGTLAGALAIGAGLALSSCGPAPAPSGPVGPIVSASAALAAPPAAPSEAWTCGGDLVPPTGWQQDTGFADVADPGAREKAVELATVKLVDRLCGGDASGCPALRARVTPWKTGSNGKEVCAMAVVKAEDLDAFRKEALGTGKLDQDLDKAAGDLFPGAGASKGSKLKVVIDRLVDGGIPGGRRADWLRARLEQRLASKVELVPAPKGWAGDGLPRGADVALRGELVARREGQVPIVEASFHTWKAAGKLVALLGSARVSFAESAAPAVGDAAVAPVLEDSKGLSVHVESHAGGSLCAGEKTQVWVKSEADAFIRVVNLYGTGEALLVYPDDENPAGRVKAGANVPLAGATGFTAVPVAGSEYERFLVMSASAEAGLGAFKGMKGSCRLPPAVARELHQGRGLPAGVKVASDGYRLVTAGCASGPDRSGVAAEIAKLPECKAR